MQTDENQIFQFSWKVGVVIGVTMVMLIIPMAGVGVLVNYLMAQKKELVVEGSDSPLRKSLEDAANKGFAGKTSLGDDGRTLALEAVRPTEEAARIEGLAKAFGGYALASDDGSRLTVQVPGNQVDDFLKACQDPQVRPSLKEPDGARVFVEIVIKTKSS